MKQIEGKDVLRVQTAHPLTLATYIISGIIFHCTSTVAITELAAYLDKAYPVKEQNRQLPSLIKSQQVIEKMNTFDEAGRNHSLFGSSERTWKWLCRYIEMFTNAHSRINYTHEAAIPCRNEVSENIIP